MIINQTMMVTAFVEKNYKRLSEGFRNYNFKREISEEGKDVGTDSIR